MRNVKFFIREEQKEHVWLKVIEALKEIGIVVSGEFSDCDTAIVLSGLYTNPMVFKGKRILFTAVPEWGNLWYSMFKPVLEEYYHEIIEMPNTLSHAIKLINSVYKRECGIEVN